MKTSLAWILVSGCLVVGCGKREAPPAADSVGVAECDDYLKKVELCPTTPAQKVVLDQTKVQMTAMFKSMATTPAGREKLQIDCLDHLKRLPPTCSR
ncbi:MAG: hypothetical protein ABJE95_22885 [Byssovorax sp.]